ncbi:MAG: hypothetical protein ACSHX5_01755 [Phycisphaerales bacterium]
MYDPSADQWSALGSGMIPAIQTSVWDATIAADGTLYAGGQFSSAGGNSDAWNVGSYNCITVCDADINGDGVLDFFDISGFLNGAPDFNGDGQFDFFDVSDFIAAFSVGCP